jgi:pimeloyl-ACP methyl ester carboxylesterase
MPFANINGVEIHYEIAGEGPTLVWLHGGMGSIERSRLAGEGVEGLAERGVRVIVYDARGHGESGFTPDEADYTWEALARDMLGLLDHLGIERASLGGGSMGARVSLTLAMSHPERVEKLVLLALPGFGDEFQSVRDTFLPLATLIESVGVEKATDVVMQLPQFAELEKSDPEEHARMKTWFAGLRPDSTVTTIRSTLNDTPLEVAHVRDIRTPALIIGVEGDPLHPASTAHMAHEAMDGSRLIMGDEPQYWRKHREEFLEAIVQFLTN